jgi:DNA-binding response OmpR family regulator
MKGKIFLIHWNASEAKAHAEKLRADGWDVGLECEDGNRAYSLIKANPPDAVVIYLERLPTHGRETADALRSLKATRALPIIFVGGNEAAIEKTRLKVTDAVFTSPQRLKDALRKSVKPGIGSRAVPKAKSRASL